MKHATIIHPRYQETDQMGIIHHSVYPVWYELGRVEFCNAIGVPFHEIEARGLRQAMIDLHVTYKEPARFGEPVILHTYVKAMSQVKLTFGYDLYSQEGRLLNQGETVLAWLDQHLKPISLQRKAPELHELLLSMLIKED